MEAHGHVPSADPVIATGAEDAADQQWHELSRNHFSSDTVNWSIADVGVAKHALPVSWGLRLVQRAEQLVQLNAVVAWHADTRHQTKHSTDDNDRFWSRPVSDSRVAV